MPSRATKTEAAHPAESAHLKRWLARYGIPDAVAKWRSSADKTRSPLLAFTAIACEAQVLMRLDPEHARGMVRDACALVEQVEAAAKTPATAAAAEAVKARITQWQLHVSGMSSKGNPDHTAADPAQPRAAAHLTDRSAAQTALAEFPQFGPSTAPYLFNMARSLGPRGLLQLGAPMDMVLALGAARVAARSSKGKHYAGLPASRTDCLEVIGAVQAWGVMSEKNALIVPGYPGRGGLSHRILAIAVDSNTCANLGQELPGGCEAAGFSMWEVAEEYHAYALMLLDRNPLDEMAFDQALLFASAAGRLAERALADPDVLLPVFPEGMDMPSPQRVLSYARAMTGGAIAARRSAASPQPRLWTSS
jgi:hypothetical protein